MTKSGSSTSARSSGLSPGTGPFPKPEPKMPDLNTAELKHAAREYLNPRSSEGAALRKAHARASQQVSNVYGYSFVAFFGAVAIAYGISTFVKKDDMQSKGKV